MSPLFSQILDQKSRRRQTLAHLTFSEKIRIVEKLRATSLRIAAAASRQKLSAPPPVELPAKRD